MSKNPVFGVMSLMLAAAVLSLAAAPVAGAVVGPTVVFTPAGTAVLTPAGTKVSLTFLDPVDTGKAASGDRVRFKVAADVIVNEHVVIRQGTALVGTVKEVGHPFPQNAGFANITSLDVRAVDRTMVGLKDVRVSAPLFGGNIRVAAGDPATTSTKADVTIKVP